MRASGLRPRPMARIGLLAPDAGLLPLFEIFEGALRALGYAEGESVELVRRLGGEGQPPLERLAAELVARPVDVIVAASALATRAAQAATRTIPIVMVAVGDPVGFGFVERLERPGGNITGLSDLLPQAAGERLQLLRAVAPGIARVAVLRYAAAPPVPAMEAAARTLGLELRRLDVVSAADVEQALDRLPGLRAGGLVVVPNPLTLEHRQRIVEAAATARLPAIYGYRQFVEAGGLMSYGASVAELYRRAAVCMHRILDGASPAELAVERPARFELVLNPRTAAGLGIAFPPAVQEQATDLLE